MLAIAAAVVFAVAWILHLTETSTNIFFGNTSLLLLGLTLAALHLAGLGAGWSPQSRRRR
ncbi:hypothetical protein [Streptomyces alboniger]|uniref:Uncharacterized protein n=1 Tax=Streptomyces alboniger TaxID=132473 RepID=A0A5J6HGI1_STRAD|nr:hypothetical protein [Streptomyces alboniger]QEV16307.1 hypothetical protein CP975_01205 [Streptomyces alboniger]